MKLEEYLEAIAKCPDEVVEYVERDGKAQKHNRLTVDFGIYDNWPILLKADFSNVVELLLKNNFEVESRSPVSSTMFLNYKPGTVLAQVCDNAPMGICSSKFDCPEDYFRQIRNYSMYVMLHPYQDKKIVGMSNMKGIALVVNEVSQLLKQHEIPFCFPKTTGWKHEKSNSSDIVYYP